VRHSPEPPLRASSSLSRRSRRPRSGWRCGLSRCPPPGRAGRLSTVTGTQAQQLRKASGPRRRPLALLVGLLLAILTAAVGASPAAAGTRVGASTPELILLVGPQTGITAGHVGVHTLPGWQLASTTGVAAKGAPLALEASTRVAPWAGRTLSRLTQGQETMYRVWGGGSGQAGSWLTPVKPTSSAAARAGLALPAENAAIYVSEVAVPAGTRIQVGVAGEAFGMPGGWSQVELLERIPMESFGKGWLLGP